MARIVARTLVNLVSLVMFADGTKASESERATFVEPGA
jgi:hypothetical protein